MEKPWDNDQLQLIIRNGLEKQKLRSLFRKRSIRSTAPTPNCRACSSRSSRPSRSEGTVNGNEREARGVVSESNERIVVVDDEEMVLTSIESFLTLETDYDVQTFNKPSEALEFVTENDVHLVISDYLMPEMDGISLLGKVREVKPDVTRIILTGYADKENAIKAINEVGLFQYVEKPWDNDQLQIIIRNGLEKGQLLRQLRGKIDEINGLQRPAGHSAGDLQGLFPTADRWDSIDTETFRTSSSGSPICSIASMRRAPSCPSAMRSRRSLDTPRTS